MKSFHVSEANGNLPYHQRDEFSPCHMLFHQSFRIRYAVEFYFGSILVACPTVFKNCLFIYFWLCRIFIVAWAFSGCGNSGLLSTCSVQASHCCGFSCCRVQVPEYAGYSICGTPAELSPNMWHCPRPGNEPMSPTLAGRFLTTGPPSQDPVLQI